MWHAISENFILRQILENFSDLGIKVRELWDTNYKLGHVRCVPRHVVCIKAYKVCTKAYGVYLRLEVYAKACGVYHGM